MSVLVFEDERVGRLSPITISRPAYAVSCGGYRLVDWLRQLDAPLRGHVRPHLRQLQEVDFPDLSGSSDVRLLVNARLQPSRSNYLVLRKLLESRQGCVVRDRGEVAAAVAPAPIDAASFDGPDQSWLHDLAQQGESSERLELFQFPHDVIRGNMSLLAENVEHRLQRGEYREAEPGLFVAEGVKLGPYVVSDTSDGPILVESGASIGPHSFLSGPAYVGAGTRLIEHAAIKDACCIGHTAKIGGEVEASIIEPYSNKQHYGFLGHSYLGSWINLGAGTCNSDLKNTYGKINMEYGGQRHATGMQFMGCLIGDYSKSAINTGIFTGKTIGVCSMVYGFVTTNVPSFVNFARLFGQVSELPPDVMIATQKRMFLRRKVEQRECDIQLIRDMYELTRHERQVSVDQLSL